MVFCETPPIPSSLHPSRYGLPEYDFADPINLTNRKKGSIQNLGDKYQNKNKPVEKPYFYYLFIDLFPKRNEPMHWLVHP